MSANDEWPPPMARFLPHPPGAIPAHDVKPMTGPTYVRREALRLAIEHHRATEADFTDTEVLATAARFAEFIRTGAPASPAAG